MNNMIICYITLKRFSLYMTKRKEISKEPSYVKIKQGTNGAEGHLLMVNHFLVFSIGSIP